MSKTKGSKLPFVITPRFQPIVDTVGDPDYGVIEIVRRGYLNVAEKTFVNSCLSGDSAISGLRRLALEIARETGKSQTEVLQDISDIENLEDYLTGYTEKIIEAVSEISTYQEKRAIACATALMIFRVDENWTIEDTLNELPSDLVTDLMVFYDQEESKNISHLAEKYNDKIDSGESDAEGKP
jgi:hypothetical protein